jgi:hypothetical protein
MMMNIKPSASIRNNYNDISKLCKLAIPTPARQNSIMNKYEKNFSGSI